YTASGLPRLRVGTFENRFAISAKMFSKPRPTLGKTNGNPGNLILVATREEFVPITAKHGTQTHQRWQAGKVVASLHVLNVAGAHANFFGKSFLGQIPPRPQCGHILSEPLSMRTGFGLARHDRIFAKSPSAKHEALLRDPFA